jgi:hypothetical protein
VNYGPFFNKFYQVNITDDQIRRDLTSQRQVILGSSLFTRVYVRLRRPVDPKVVSSSLIGLSNLISQFKDLGTESRKLGLSLSRNWLFAAGKYHTRVNRLLNEMPYTISRIKQLTNEPKKDLPKLSQIVQELNQLEDEFSCLDYDKENDVLLVETESITLDDVYLGPFQIQLHTEKIFELYKDNPYFIVALDAHPAATCEDVTHPHVSNEKLCEGDGSVIIRASLEQGRLCDFFTMIRSILNTYNPDSPYVALADWDGEPCYDCGYVTSRENSYYCTFCDRDYCDECSTYCRNCDETICLGCVIKCEFCEDSVCTNCIRTCAECVISCCESCLEEDLCQNCKEELENQENEEQKANKTETNEKKDQNENRTETLQGEKTANSEIQPHSVGETAVLQR